MTTHIPASVYLKSEIAKDPKSQCALLISKFFASTFKASSAFIPDNSSPLLPLLTDYDVTSTQSMKYALI